MNAQFSERLKSAPSNGRRGVHRSGCPALHRLVALRITSGHNAGTNYVLRYPTAMRSPSLLTRTLRVLTAIVTVACLNCSAWEGLLDGRLGAASGAMDCASSTASDGSWTQTAVGSASTAINTLTAPFDEFPDGLSCNCSGCHAPSPAFLTMVVAAPRPEPVLVRATAMLVSVERQPLVPPPVAAL
jgi:hypothetical protein